MKKSILTCLIIAIAIITKAQNTGIGTTAPQSKLDITAANPSAPTNQDGMLIPRLNVFPATNPTTNQNGMMVYLNNAVGTNLPGFYYWEQSSLSWKGVGTNTGWGLKGNTGTTTANNFIGTVDDNDLIFKRNNEFSGTLGFSTQPLVLVHLIQIILGFEILLLESWLCPTMVAVAIILLMEPNPFFPTQTEITTPPMETKLFFPTHPDGTTPPLETKPFFPAQQQVILLP